VTLVSLASAVCFKSKNARRIRRGLTLSSFRAKLFLFGVTKRRNVLHCYAFCFLYVPFLSSTYLANFAVFETCAIARDPARRFNGAGSGWSTPPSGVPLRRTSTSGYVVADMVLKPSLSDAGTLAGMGVIVIAAAILFVRPRTAPQVARVAEAGRP
jgi:hypothetical protein